MAIEGGLAGEDRSAHVVTDRRDETVSAKGGLLATRDTTHGSPKEDHENEGPPYRPQRYYCKDIDVAGEERPRRLWSP